MTSNKCAHIVVIGDKKTENALSACWPDGVMCSACGQRFVPSGVLDRLAHCVGDAYGIIIYPKADWVGASVASCQIRVPNDYVATFTVSGTTGNVHINGPTTTDTPIPCTTYTP